MITEHRTQVVMLVALSVVFGSAFLLMKVVADDAPPLQVVATRMTIGALVLGVLLKLRTPGPRTTPRINTAGVFLGLAGMVIPFGLSAWAIQYMDSGTGAVLNSTIPIFTGVFAALLVAGERLTPNRIAGLAAGFAGVAVLAGGTVFDASGRTMVAQLAQVGAAASLAFSGVYAKRLLVEQDALALSWVQIGAGAVIAWPLLFVVNGVPSFELSAGAWAAVIALGAVQSGVAWAAYVWLIERAGSVRASLLTYLMPPVGLFLGWLFLDEQLTALTVGGLALIVSGIALVLRPRHQAEPPALASVPLPPAIGPVARAREA